jgi:hypothetical protein
MYVLKIGSFHLVTPPKCQKLPSSIPKTAHVKFRATSCSFQPPCGDIIGVGIRCCHDKVYLPYAYKDRTLQPSSRGHSNSHARCKHIETN